MTDSREISITVFLGQRAQKPRADRPRPNRQAVARIRLGRSRQKRIDHATAAGIAVKEYATSIGPADYVLFSEKKALGVVEAKPDSWGVEITTVEEQFSGYAAAQLKMGQQPHRSPEPEELAEEIIENIEAGLASLKGVLAGLGTGGYCDNSRSCLNQRALRGRPFRPVAILRICPPTKPSCEPVPPKSLRVHRRGGHCRCRRGQVDVRWHLDSRGCFHSGSRKLLSESRARSFHPA